MTREMKDSGVPWIGIIPKNWNTQAVKSIFHIIAGATPQSANSDYWDGDINWVTPADYKTEQKYITSGKRSLTSEGLNSCSASLVPENSLIVSKRAPIGTVAITKAMLSTNQGCLSCVAKNKNFDIDYAYYTMIAANEELNLRGEGTTFKEISLSSFSAMKIPYPQYEEQKEISRLLNNTCDKISEAISRHQSIIEKLEEYKKAIITQAVTKGLNPEVEMKDSGVKFVGMIPVNWTVQRLKFCLSESLKYGANESGINYNENLPRYIRITDITEDGKLKEADKLSLTIEQANNYILKDKDILLARSGATVGKSFLYKKEYGIAAFAGYLIKATVNEKLLPEYFNYITQSSYYSLWKDWIFSQATIQNIGADKYNQLPTVIPSIEEQIDITNYLDNKCAKIAEAISRQKAAIEKLEEYRKSLIYNAVTGKIDCREAAYEA